MNIDDAKAALDKVITKTRVHFYKPIQIAEILYHDRMAKGIGLDNLDNYRKQSKKWRDEICEKFIGRVSSSSAMYQDNIFGENAIPPQALDALGKVNRKNAGIVEAYIYRKFSKKIGQMSNGLSYCMKSNKKNFDLNQFINLFRNEPGLKRSLDKVYEIIVFSLFSALVESLEVNVEVSMNPDKTDILKEFKDFADSVLQLSPKIKSFKIKGRINRVGVTNAADRGLDMWANFGLAIQIKHLRLDEELAEGIVSSITADRIVIVCKDAEKALIVSLLNQIGWKARIQAIITETNLVDWYEKGLRGKFSNEIGDKILTNIRSEMVAEFPSSDNKEFNKFFVGRGYDKTSDKFWEVI